MFEYICVYILDCLAEYATCFLTMLAKALFCLAAAVHFAELKPKGKYFLIETQDKVGVGEDFAKTEEEPPKPMMTNEGKTNTK